VRQGEVSDELFLVLDGVLVADVDGEPLAEFGPGAVLGERAILEQGARTATLRAATKCRVAAVPADRIDRDALEDLREGHRREERSG
jgi:CRP-like cAMP-binding protein